MIVWWKKKRGKATSRSRRGEQPTGMEIKIRLKKREGRRMSDWPNTSRREVEGKKRGG